VQALRSICLQMMDHKALNAIESDIWNQLGRALVDRRSPMRWFTLATISSNEPQARTVVLRGSDREARTLTFYTDRRTPKVTEILASPNVSCLFLNAKTMQQYRFSGPAEVLSEGSVWQAHWERLSDRGKQDYSSLTVPGQVGEMSYKSALARDNFCVVEVTAHQLDWLSLAREGHQRAVFDWSGAEAQAKWVAP